MSAPRLSVLMTVYNGGRYLRPAIDSVLAQDFSDFEFIIVDDGSTDGSVDVVRAVGDPRIRLHVNDRNRGQTPSLNIGLRLCRGAFIARLDADDLCLPGRFRRQVAFLDAHPDIGILGGSVTVIDGEGRPGERSPLPTDDAALRWLSMTRNPFHHPAVTLRHDLIERTGHYFDEQYGANQDYDLWDRLLPHTQIANLAEDVVAYRVHGNNISVLRLGEQQAMSLRFGARRIAAETGIVVAPNDLAGIYAAVHGSCIVCGVAPSPPARALSVLLDLTDAYLARHHEAVSVRRLAGALALRTWLVRSMGAKRLVLLDRILRLSPSAMIGAIRLLVPQTAGLIRRALGK
ncbi:MAG: glycosyltransferase [Alphaproteobacteria bacterium]|nr:glycosyltransferase [Alphaproteobacteria bacterium]